MLQEILAITDDQTWIWNFIRHTLAQTNRSFVRLPSTVPIRQSWNRFKDGEKIVIHWEAKQRSGGALVEEILDISPKFNVSERIIVVSTNPTHEDVVYFNELGIHRVIKIRNRDKELQQATQELTHHIKARVGADKEENAWRSLHYAFDTLPAEVDKSVLDKLQAAVHKLSLPKPTARYLDAKASLAALQGDGEKAYRLWMQALEKNPNYFRSYNNLIKFHRRRQETSEALALMQKMQSLNRSNISRLVGMGELQLSTGDSGKAEFYFRSALDRDSFCSGALNGLAEIRFGQGDLEATRQLLARSNLAYQAASKLNRQGIELVARKKFEVALEHYTKAQYVLPQQDRGPMLFYNIGLCYSKWGRLDTAKEFLRVALIKEPDYRKAKRLLESIESQMLGEAI